MAQPVKNLGFLGLTFNSIKLDPLLPESAGLAQNVIDWTHVALKPTPDDTWSIPDGATYAPRTLNQYSAIQFDQNTIQTTTSDFSETVTVGAKVPLIVSCKASTTVKTSSKAINERQVSVIWTQQLVQVITLALPPQTSPFQLAVPFKTAVAGLKPLIRLDQAPWNYDTYNDQMTKAKALGAKIPMQLQPEQWNAGVRKSMQAANPAAFEIAVNFLRQFGSHYAAEVTFGGLRYRRTEISKENVEYYKSKGVDVKVEAEGSFQKVTGSASSATTKTTTEDFIQRTGNTNSIITVVGGDSGAAPEAWAATVRSNPSVVGLKLRPLYELFTHEFFPNDAEIDLKREMMMRLVEGENLIHLKPLPVVEIPINPFFPNTPDRPLNDPGVMGANVYAFMNRGHSTDGSHNLGDDNILWWSYVDVPNLMLSLNCYKNEATQIQDAVDLQRTDKLRV